MLYGAPQRKRLNYKPCSYLSCRILDKKSCKHEQCFSSHGYSPIYHLPIAIARLINAVLHMLRYCSKNM